MLVFSTGKETKPLFYRSRKMPLCERRKTRKRDERSEMTRYSHVRKKHESDCSIMTAELFFGIGEMAPRDDTGLGRRQSSDIEKTSAGSNKTLSGELREHTGLAEMSTVYGQRCHSVGCYIQGFMPLGDGLVSERHGTDHPTCVAELKSGPVTTTLGV
jgi:hypothetical protein